MGWRSVAALAAVVLLALAGCRSEDRVELESPVGEPAPLPGPTLAPPVPADTVPFEEDTLPVLRQDSL